MTRMTDEEALAVLQQQVFELCAWKEAAIVQQAATENELSATKEELVTTKAALAGSVKEVSRLKADKRDLNSRLAAKTASEQQLKNQLDQINKDMDERQGTTNTENVILEEFNQAYTPKKIKSFDQLVDAAEHTPQVFKKSVKPPLPLTSLAPTRKVFSKSKKKGNKFAHEDRRISRKLLMALKLKIDSDRDAKYDSPGERAEVSGYVAQKVHKIMLFKRNKPLGRRN